MFIMVQQEVYRVLWKEQKGSWVIRFDNLIRPQFLSEAQMEVCQRVPALEWYLQSVNPERKHSKAETRKTAMLLEHFTNDNGKLLESHPTWNSFWQYCYFHNLHKDSCKQIARDGWTNYQRNHRMLLGSAQDWKKQIGCYNKIDRT